MPAIWRTRTAWLARRAEQGGGRRARTDINDVIRLKARVCRTSVQPCRNCTWHLQAHSAGQPGGKPRVASFEVDLNGQKDATG